MKRYAKWSAEALALSLTLALLLGGDAEPANDNGRMEWATRS
jgi:hypothetical protein